MKAENYLLFNGNCAKAMKFYEKTLSGKLSLMPVKGSPAEGHTPPGSLDAVLHARLEFDGGVLMASDWLTPQPYPGMGGFSVCITAPTVKEAKRLFDALSSGGTVTMPFNKTFWVEAFGGCVDRFGTPWMINGGKALQ